MVPLCYHIYEKVYEKDLSVNMKNKGVTMMELLISLNIIVFGVFIMAVVMCFMLRSSQTNIDNSAAYIVADSVLKSYVTDKATFEELMEGQNSSFRSTGKGATVSYGDKVFSYEITAQKVADTADMVYLKATVKEIEASGGKKGMNASISTLVSPKTGIK